MNFRVIIWNCDGLLSKFDDPDLVTYLSGFSFICLCETFLEYFDHTRHFSNYDCYVSPARKLSGRGRRSGGVICLIAKSYSHLFAPVKTVTENVLLFKAKKELFGVGRDVMIICSYIPPQGSPYYDSIEESNGVLRLEECIIDVLQIHSDCEVMICGDLNARTGMMDAGNITDWYETRHDGYAGERCSEDSKTNDFGLSLLSMLIAFNLIILNGYFEGDKTGKFTYLSSTGNSVVDYCIVSPNLLPCCQSLQVLDCTLSPHMYLILTMNSVHQENYLPVSEASVKRIFWDNNMAELYISNLQENLSNSSLLQILDNGGFDVNDAVERLTTSFVQSADFMSKTFVNRKQNSQKKPWYDAECYSIRKRLRILLRWYRNDRSEPKKKDYIECRRLYKELIRQKKRNYNIEMSSSLTGNVQNPELFWKCIRKICGGFYTLPNIPVHDWYEHFTAVFCQSTHELSNDWEETINQRHSRVVADDSSLNAPFEQSEIQLALTCLKSKKSPGVDDICSEMLSCSSGLILPYLTKLFNEIFSTGIYPFRWSESIVVPIYKRGNMHEVNNYRGISLTSILSKVFVHVLKSRLTDWADDNKIISEEQAGFRKGYSTIDNVFTLCGIIQRQLERRKKLYVAYIDFRKAFDSVNREALWKILERNGVRGHMINVLKSMYSSVQCRVKCLEGLSDLIECLMGLKQGCKASSILFLYMIDEVAKEMKKFGKHGVQLMPDSTIVHMLMFADDVALLSDTVPGLQNQLNVLHQVSKNLGLMINAEKTKVVVYRMGGHVARHEKWFLGGERLEVVNSYKYLGMVISTKLSPVTAQADLVYRAKAGLIQVVKSLRNINSVDPLVFFKLFDTRIQPILLYSSEVWGFDDCQTIENIHVKGMKMFCNVSAKTPNIMLYGDCGRYPLSISANIRAVKYWCKILRMEPSRYPAKVYRMMLQNIEKGRNWAFKLRKFLIMYNFESIWLAQEVQNEHAFIKSVKEVLMKSYHDEWVSQLYSSNRYLLYRQIKQQPTLENYLRLIDKKVFREMYIKFRMGVSELFNHKYRFRQDSPSMLCPSCREDEEDDTHFLLECPAYEDLRSRHIRFLVAPMPFSYVSLLSSNDAETVKNVSTYLFHAFKRRRCALDVIEKETDVD